jgi:hypothetical protein
MSRHERLADPEGLYRLRWLDPGRYEISVEASGRRSVRTLELPPDAVEWLEVALGPD